MSKKIIIITVLLLASCAYAARFGNVSINGNTISSLDTDGNIVIDPNGTGVVDVNSSRIINLIEPSGAQDAATMNYVDTEIGLIDLSGKADTDLNNLSSVDLNTALTSTTAQEFGTANINGSVGDLSFRAGFDTSAGDYGDIRIGGRAGGVTSTGTVFIENINKFIVTVDGAVTLNTSSLVLDNGGSNVNLITPLGTPLTINANGDFAVRTFNSSTGDADPTPSISIITGDKLAGTGDSGDLSLTIGTSSGGTQGEFKFLKTGVAAVVNQIWTATNVDGSGYWASPAAGGATIELDNLGTTAVNTNIRPANTAAVSLGSDAKHWLLTYSKFFINNISGGYFGSDFNKGTVATFQSGQSSGASITGNVTVKSGDQLGGGSGTIGDVIIESGEIFEATNANDTGDVILSPGATAGAGARGAIVWDDASVGTSGECLLSIDTAGAGEWGTCPGGSATVNAWHGHADDDCNWSDAGSGYTYPTGDSACGGMIEIFNSNMGTVSMESDGTGEQPSLVFTVQDSGIYKICASVNFFNDGSLANVNTVYEIVDGSNVKVAQASTQNKSTSTTDSKGVYACGFKDLTATNVETFRIRVRDNGAGNIILGTFSSAAPGLVWTVEKL